MMYQFMVKVLKSHVENRALIQDTFREAGLLGEVIVHLMGSGDSYGQQLRLTQRYPLLVFLHLHGIPFCCCFSELAMAALHLMLTHSPSNLQAFLQVGGETLLKSFLHVPRQGCNIHHTQRAFSAQIKALAAMESLLEVCFFEFCC